MKIKEVIMLIAVSLILAGSADAEQSSPINGYGINTHLLARKHAFETANADRILKRLGEDGLGTVRIGFSWGAVQGKQGSAYDFSDFDRIFAVAATNKIEILPLLKGPPGWAKPVWKHIDSWKGYVRAFVARYGNQISCVEIWNEQNTKGFWKDPREKGTRQNPYVEDYVDLLKASYDTIKETCPKLKVAIGGFSAVPMPYIRNLYKAGGNRYFDVMNVHPYSRPLAPEGSFDTRLEELREFMNTHNDAHKQIRISEVGWPTHRIEARHPELLAEGLKKANPERTAWRVAYAQFEKGVDDPDGSLIASLELSLPRGSRIVPLEGNALARALKQDEFDAVMMPLMPDFRTEAAEDIKDFVKRGGVLVWFGKRFARPARLNNEGFIVGDSSFNLSDFRKFFRFSQEDRKQQFKAAVVRAAGLKEGDSFEPLRVVKDVDGKELITAAVIHYGSDMKGAVVYSGYDEAPGGTSEMLQAKYLIRMMAMAAAIGVVNIEYYDLVALETSPYESEHNYGIWHSDLSPKPAYKAYCEYIRKRPPGSVNRSDKQWKTSDAVWFFPSWTLPDGKEAGLLWKRGHAAEREIDLGSSEIKFFDLFGKQVYFPKGSADGKYRISVGEAPVYWQQ